MMHSLSETARWGDLLARERLEHARNDLEGRCLVLLLQVGVFGDILLGEVELCIDFLVLWPLRNQERVSRCSLTNGRIEANDELDMEVIQLR